MSIAVRQQNNCNARWAQLIIDSWMNNFQPAPSHIRIRIQRQTGFSGCSGPPVAGAVNGEAQIECETWGTTHSYTNTIANGPVGNFWTPMTQRTGGMERHRECYQFRRYDQVALEWRWQSYSCSPWRY